MISTSKTIGVCLVAVLCGCMPKMQEDEVFVLLKSDEVKPLADIEVIGFSGGFRQDLMSWQEKWNEDFLNPEALVKKEHLWQTKLAEFDRQIQSKLAETNALSERAKSSVETSVRYAEGELISISNFMAKTRGNLETNASVLVGGFVRKFEITPPASDLKSIQSRVVFLRSSEGYQSELERIKREHMYEVEALREKRAKVVSVRWTPKIGPPVKMDFPRSAGEKADDESQTQTA